MAKYEVYLHNVPKVTEDGKPAPIAPHEKKEFDDLEAAKKVAAENKDGYERVVVMSVEDGKQRMVERYMDGEHIVPEPKPEDDETETADAEADSSGEAN